jgi:hypothetical protein
VNQAASTFAEPSEVQRWIYFATAVFFLFLPIIRVM